VADFHPVVIAVGKRQAGYAQNETAGDARTSDQELSSGNVRFVCGGAHCVARIAISAAARIRT